LELTPSRSWEAENASACGSITRGTRRCLGYYLLDTNAWIGYLRQNNARLVQRFFQVAPTDILLNSVVLGELFYGAHHGATSKLAANLALISRLQQRFTSLPFDDRAAADYGEIRADLDAKGTPIGPNDLMIAAIARVHGLTLVTHDTAEFSRVPGLRLEDWQ
jgi:tRNA(fMet)-specific endonuclease VapC